MALTNYQNLEGVRDVVRIRSGLTEKGATGDARLNTWINLAFRQLWEDQPDVFQKQEIRIRLQPAITGTLDICPTDYRVARLSAGSFLGSSVVDGSPGTLRARWIDITDADGVIHTRRILTVGRSITDEDWGDGAFNRDIIIMDRPMGDDSLGLSFRIYTLDYPLPADVQDIDAVIRNPETDGYDELTGVYPAELDRMRLGNWDETGQPEVYSNGDFFQLPAPHSKPLAIQDPAANTNPEFWGFNGSGVEEPSYGAAGTFSYCYCLVWGRLKSPTRDLADDNDASSRQYAPFYISAPSEPSDQVSTEWGDRQIAVATKQDDWERMRKLGIAEGISGMRSDLNPFTGLEKWIFRARHASVTESGPDVAAIASDGVYRLWRIIDADTTVTYDKGDSDPVDYSFPLKEFTGHKSIRFDRTPADDTTVVLVRATVRPAILEHDQDVLPIPPPAVEAVINRVCQYVTERDGDLNKAAYYRAEYEASVNKLRQNHGWSSAKKTGMGDGLSVGRVRNWTLNSRIRGVDP